jgi:hypothetical protein
MLNVPSRSLQRLCFPFEFSICTLVTKASQYAEMLQSFSSAGFLTEFCEYLHIDNVNQNQFDGYQGLSMFLQSAKGRYIIICHQDVLLDFDDIKVLRKRINELDRVDPHWAVLGNAGYSNFNNSAMCISDPYGEHRRSGNLPVRCQSLDENFIVVKSAANLGVSRDLNGFHFYATDLCVMAKIMGWHAYVIDFHLRHKGAGTKDVLFYEAKNAFIKKYSRHSATRFIRTTCTMLIISSFDNLNNLLNCKFVYSLIKRWDRLFPN